jgi:hypothetical protein
MNSPARFQLRAGAPGATARESTGTAGAAPAGARSQVLPPRHAPRQLELPLLFAPAAPRHRLRTG